MVTKRSILEAGVLALALALAACSQDRAGAATGVAGPPDPSAAPHQAPPAAPAPGRAAGAASAAGAGSTGEDIRTWQRAGDGDLTFTADGHRYSFLETNNAAGTPVTRIVQDGVVLMEVEGGLRSVVPGAEVSASVYYQGELLTEQSFIMTGAVSDRAAGSLAPQREMAYPCAAELGAFAAASSYLSFELYVNRYWPSRENFRNLVRAIIAEAAAGAALVACVSANW